MKNVYYLAIIFLRIDQVSIPYGIKIKNLWPQLTDYFHFQTVWPALVDINLSIASMPDIEKKVKLYLTDK